jgi:hypothetical protein
VTFVAGQAFPVAAEASESRFTLPIEPPSPVRLLAPVLQGLPRARVGFVLLVASGPFLDQEDWDPGWQRKGYVYCPGTNDRPDWLPPWEFIPGRDDPNDAVRGILAALPNVSR